MGMVLVYALSISNRKLIFVSISVLLLISQIINSNSISIDSRKTREEDKVYGKIISEMVKEYEEKNNIKLKKIEYCFDNSPTRGYKGLRKTTEPTCRGFCGSWIMDNIFNYYCKNHNFTKKYNQGIISKLDLIQFQENLLTIERLVAQQKVECIADAISIYKATGSKPYADIK